MGFFVNLLDMKYEWKPAGEIYEGRDRSTGDLKWKASAVDLSLGSNPELRAIAEHFTCSDSKQPFAEKFAAAWAKVMDNDKYDGSFWAVCTVGAIELPCTVETLSGVGR